MSVTTPGRVIARGAQAFPQELAEARRLGFKFQHVIGDPVPPELATPVASRLVPMTVPAAEIVRRVAGDGVLFLEARIGCNPGHETEALQHLMSVLLAAARDAA